MFSFLICRNLIYVYVCMSMYIALPYNNIHVLRCPFTTGIPFFHMKQIHFRGLKDPRLMLVDIDTCITPPPKVCYRDKQAVTLCIQELSLS